MESEEICVISINNNTWKIKIAEEEAVRNRINRDIKDEQKKASYGFGLCEYPTHTIYISKDSCYEEQIVTVRHEVMHAYLWSVGAKGFVQFDEEDVCHFSALAYPYITKALDLFERKIKNESKKS